MGFGSSCIRNDKKKAYIFTEMKCLINRSDVMKAFFLCCVMKPNYFKKQIFLSSFLLESNNTGANWPGVFSMLKYFSSFVAVKLAKKIRAIIC